MLFAETANYTSDGRLNIIGEFITLSVPQVPVVVASLNVLFRYFADVEYWTSPHEVKVTIETPSGGALAEEVTPWGPPYDELIQVAIAEKAGILSASSVQFAALALPAVGKYVVRLLIDGAEVASRTLKVAVADPQSPSA